MAIALAAALLCGIPLFGPGMSQVAFSATAPSTIRAKCFSYKALRASSTVCEYGFEQPFLLRGYSRGGSSTLSYTVQCGNDPSWPTNPAAIDRRVWYKRSLTVRGDFKVHGAKSALPAAKHCVAARGKAALLSVKLKMNRGVTRTNLIVRLDNNLPWND